MDLHTQNNSITPVLQTERLTLRAVCAADGPVCVDALNAWEVTKWLTSVPFPYAQSDFDWYLTHFVTDPENTVWAIDLDNSFVGVIGVRPDLGYWLHPQAQGRGVITEAAIAAVDWYFAQSSKALQSGYHMGNAASANVLNKLGFAKTTVTHNATTARGDLVDMQHVQLTATHWQANQRRLSTRAQ